MVSLTTGTKINNPFTTVQIGFIITVNVNNPYDLWTQIEKEQHLNTLE